MITSAANQQMRQLRDLLNKGKERRKQQCFVAEGLRMVAETPKSLLEQIYISESFSKNLPNLRGLDISKAIVVSDAVFDRISDTQNPQGIMAVVRFTMSSMNQMLRKPNAMQLFLESIQDPGNLGTMMRTAEGAGISGVIIGGNTVDIFNPKVVRSTMGSLYRMPFVYVEDLCGTIKEARRLGIDVHAAHLAGSTCYDGVDYTKPCGFLIGNEANGLTPSAAAAATDCIHIPMAGQLESLNAAAAAAILMYEAGRQRRIKSTGSPIIKG